MTDLSAKNEVNMVVASLVLCLGTLLGAGAPPAAQKPAPLRISSVVMQAKVIHADPPKYPEEARSKNIQGVVTLDIIIGKNGAVESVKVTDGPKELTKAAVNAVKHWRYEPTLLNGKPVEVETTVELGFKLTPPKKKTPEKGPKQN
jgi:TonB family protein